MFYRVLAKHGTNRRVSPLFRSAMTGRQWLWGLSLLLLFLPAFPALADSNLILNPNFDTVLPSGPSQNWTYWERTPGSGSVAFDKPGPQSHIRSVKVTYHNTDDWSFASDRQIPVHPGEIYEISGWVKAEGAQDAQLSVVTRSADGQTLDWSYGGINVASATNWTFFHRKFVVPANCATIEYRLIGSGNETVWLDEASLVRVGNIADFQAAGAGKPLALDNALLHVRIDTGKGLLSITDKRNGRAWRQDTIDNGEVVQSAHRDGQSVVLTLWNVSNDLTLKATITLAKDKPEVTVALQGQGALNSPLPFPQPFATGRGTWLVVPLDEGILYPVDDPTIDPMTLLAYQGHGGLSMPWYGVADLKSGAGLMTVLQTPDDA